MYACYRKNKLRLLSQKNKEGKLFCLVFYAVGRFLIAISIRAPIMAIAAIMAAVEIAKYISVGGKATTG